MKIKESVIREFLNDPLLVEKGYITEDDVAKIILSTKSPSKMVELIKTVITSKFSGDTDNVTTRKINILLNPSE
jgi:hypothetical protein